MSLEEVQQKMKCRRCDRPRIITRVSKPKADTVKLYMRCPVHTSEVVYRMPFSQYEPASGIIREHVLLCRKCGQPVDITGQRAGKLSTKVRIHCPEHGIGERTVNNSLLDSILAGVPTKAAPEAAAPAGSSKFCSSCGQPVPAPEARFCHNCGASID
ncbi:MAG: zinc-ribbon domain-containing protein [Candidatus Hermodarchaeia archaeon]|jgi:hypothetical protein